MGIKTIPEYINIDEINLVDSHCHLDSEKFQGEYSVDELVNSAAEHGIRTLQTICTRRSDFPTIHGYTQKYDNVFCSYGIHPHDADEDIVSVNEIIEHGQKDKVIGVGETGLDYFYENSPKKEQIISFEKHLEAARELDMPTIIHTRDAEDDTIKILTEALKKGQERILFHCFSSGPKLADFGKEAGIYFSASGIVTFKKSTELQQIFKTVPMDKLLVETDAPYLAPTPNRGNINIPGWTFFVSQFVADLKQMPLKELADTTTNNFFHLFSKASRPKI